MMLVTNESIGELLKRCHTSSTMLKVEAVDAKFALQRIAGNGEVQLLWNEGRSPAPVNELTHIGNKPVKFNGKISSGDRVLFCSSDVFLLAEIY